LLDDRPDLAVENDRLPLPEIGAHRAHGQHAGFELVAEKGSFRLRLARGGSGRLHTQVIDTFQGRLKPPAACDNLAIRTGKTAHTYAPVLNVRRRSGFFTVTLTSGLCSTSSTSSIGAAV